MLKKTVLKKSVQNIYSDCWSRFQKSVLSSATLRFWQKLRDSSAGVPADRELRFSESGVLCFAAVHRKVLVSVRRP